MGPGKEKSILTHLFKGWIILKKGILVCGLNGSGKSTLGRELAKMLGYGFIDIEDCYFPKNDPEYLYAEPRTGEEAEEILREKISACENFVLASVAGNFDEEITSRFTVIVRINVPKEIRMKRIRERSFRKFGERMLCGGDLYETEENFFAMVEARTEQYVDDRLGKINCRIIQIDGTKSVSENAEYIMKSLTESNFQ